MAKSRDPGLDNKLAIQLFADLLPVLSKQVAIFFLSTVRLSCSFVRSNGENCIRMRQIHSSEKEVASDLLLEREARYIWSLGLPKCVPKWQI